MTELQRYLAEEVAEDHADGLVSRREALRRLGLLGLSGVAAGSLLAAFAADAAKAGVRASRPGASGRRVGGAADARDHVSRARRPEAYGRVGYGGSASWRRAGDPREPRAQRLDPRHRGPAGGERLLGAGDRSAVGGGRHRLVRGRVRGDGRARGGARLTPRGGPESRRDGDSPPPPRQEGRGDRVLFRRRDDLAPARLEGVAPRGRRSVLRAVPGRREPRRRESCRARDLRGARLESECHTPGGAGGAAQGRPPAPDRHLPGRRPRVLQPDGGTLRRGGGRGCLSPAARPGSARTSRRSDGGAR